MNNKNWSDRADRDLFFTILSVKNIGVISGSEWVTIGNHMRVLGYGFTNEGCRQHFQGLRRAQNKSETNGAASGGGGARKSADPTMNPITRRPGPGRGRPKKSNGEQPPLGEGQSQDEASPPTSGVSPQTHEVVTQSAPPPNVPYPQHYPQPPSQPQPGHPMQFPHQGPHAQWQSQHPPQYHHAPPQEHQLRPPPQMVQKSPQGGQPSPGPTAPQSSAYPPPPSPVSAHRPGLPGQAGAAAHQPDAGNRSSTPNTANVPVAARPLPLTSENGDDDDDDVDDGDSDDRPSKRQKTDDEDAEGDGNLDDPVLALATANNGTSGDPYATNDYYGEA